MFLCDDNSFLEAIIAIMRDKWRIIENTTKYGWLTAHYQSSRISINNSDALSNLAKKVVNIDNYDRIVNQIRKLSETLHPNDVPMVAETILNELNMIMLFRERKRGKYNSGHKLNTESSTIFTIY